MEKATVIFKQVGEQFEVEITTSNGHKIGAIVENAELEANTVSAGTMAVVTGDLVAITNNKSGE